MKWIPVKERLPEVVKNVIVCNTWNDMEIAWFNGVEFTTEFRDEDITLKHITHWMPLPEPPTE